MTSVSTSPSRVKQSTQALEKNVSIPDFYILNRSLREQTKKERTKWNQHYPDSPLAYGDVTGSKAKHVQAPTLLSYTQMPAARKSFNNFGKPHVYKTGWDYKSRSTAMGIPTGAAEYTEFENSEKGGLAHSTSKVTLLPPISPNKSSSISTTTTTSSSTLFGFDDTSDTEKFQHWVYQNKNTLLTAFSGYDITGMGYMSHDRMVRVLETLDIPVDTAVLEQVVSEATMETVRSGKKVYTDVVDYAQWLHETWLTGLSIFNKYSASSPLKSVTLDPLPAYLVIDGGSTKEEASKHRAVAELVLQKRRKARDDLEYTAAKEILQQCNFETVKTEESRNRIDRTVSAYSNGKGTQRAIKEAQQRVLKKTNEINKK